MKILVAVLALDPLHWYRVTKCVFEEAEVYAVKMFGEHDYSFKLRESNGEHAVVEVWKTVPKAV